MAKPRKTTRARSRAANGTHIANITKAVHSAASRFLPKAALEPQTIQFSGGGQMMSGKLSPPVQPSYYVAVIIPVYE